jgi:hypothetical protein
MRVSGTLRVVRSTGCSLRTAHPPDAAHDASYKQHDAHDGDQRLKHAGAGLVDPRADSRRRRKQNCGETDHHLEAAPV